MMSVKTALCQGGLMVMRLSTTESMVDVPSSIEGIPVVAIGPAFLEGCHSSQGRTVRIPASVKHVDPMALDMATGLSSIEYDGDIREFSMFRLTAPSDCTVVCRDGGRRFSFPFPSKMPMSFPEFDEAAMASMLSIPVEAAMARLSDPVMLTDEAHDWYVRKLSGLVLPRAEQAVSAGDRKALEDLFSTGMLDEDALKMLLERSARSGRVPMTSVIMSLIRRAGKN